MTQRKLPKRVKKIVWSGCAHIVTEQEDGMLIEIIPMVDGRPSFEAREGGCKGSYGTDENGDPYVGCEEYGCAAESGGFKTCKVCTIEGPGHLVADVCLCCIECPEDEE